MNEFFDSDEAPVHSKGLARKLVCSVMSVVFIGGLLILLLQLGLVLTAVPDWGEETEDRMFDLEEQNLGKLASDKAEYVSEIFARVEESILQARAFAGQVLLDVPQTMVVENYLESYSGLDQVEDTWEHSVWYITNEEANVSSGSSLGGLLNRTSLMDVAFRGMQQQHTLMYLAALNDTSGPEGEVSDINMQPYAGRNTAYYLNFTKEKGCDERFDNSFYNPDNYDPRCRPWYQDAIEGNNTGVIFTNPYSDAGTGRLTLTVAAPVYDSDDSTLLQGVFGIDMDIADINASIVELTVIGDDRSNDENGYAYLLSPGSGGEVAVHRDIDDYDDGQFITTLEEGLNETEFGAIVEKISLNCNGSENYTRYGEEWLLAWKHETVSGSQGAEGEKCTGYTVVVTVSTSALSQEFSQMEEEVRNTVVLASAIMAAVLLVVCFCMAGFAVGVSNSIVKPVNQLIDVVHSLYTMDFSDQQAGPWMVNEVSSPEVGELLEAFKSMSSMMKTANMSLRDGNLNVARENYINALIVFNKLKDERGVAIATNNLGTVYTLLAQERESKVIEVGSRDPEEARRLSDEAKDLYVDAITNYRQAIDDAKMLCAAVVRNAEGLTLLQDSPATNQLPEDETKTSLEIVGTTYVEGDNSTALFLQLSSRKFNLAVCHASRGESLVPGEAVRDSEAIEQARSLLHDCIKLASKSKGDTGDAFRVKYLLELASLESRMQRQAEAGKALDDAETILSLYRDDSNEGYPPWTGHKEGSPRFKLVIGFPQRLLAARGEQFMAAGDTGSAIACWTRTIIGSGNKMYVEAVKSSLEGLRDLARRESDESPLPPELLSALDLPTEGRKNGKLLVSRINEALEKVYEAKDMMEKNLKREKSEKTSVDVCFVMDCTGSMQSWIDQAKSKLLEIIEQAKKDVGDLHLRVGFVGYRDYGDKPQYEGPYDFHTEQQLPRLISKLKRIKAFGGGTDLPEDMAGGLKLASTRLSWESDVRLCILIADAPCHGNIYHSGLGDRFPSGYRNEVDPTKMLFELKYKQGVDLYFIKITAFTDKMIRVFQTRLASLHAESNYRMRTARLRTDTEIKVHDLGSDDNRLLEAVVESVKESVKSFAVQNSHLLLEE